MKYAQGEVSFEFKALVKLGDDYVETVRRLTN